MNVLGVLLLAASFSAAAKDLPDAVLAPEAEAYASVDDAAHAALLVAMPVSRSHEHGGVILESEGVFYFTTPVTNGRSGEIAFTVLLPSTHRIVGIYHTHPDANEDSVYFSANDVAQAKAREARSYIGVMRDRSIRVFDPKTMRTRRESHSGSVLRRAEYAVGELLVSDVPLR